MDEQLDYRQTVLAEIVVAIGTSPELTMDQIQNNLGELYAQHQQAGDHNAMVLIDEAWQRVNQIASAADMAITVAAAAREMVAEMSFQRDEAIKEHAGLQKAMRDFDRDHPLVEDLLTGFEEMVGEEMMYEAAYLHMCEASNMYEVAGLDVSAEEAGTFLGMLTDTAIDDNLDPEIGQRLRDKMSKFIREIVNEYDAAAEMWDGAE